MQKKRVSFPLQQPYQTTYVELNAKIKAFEDQQQARDALNVELETKQSELTKLTEQKENNPAQNIRSILDRIKWDPNINKKEFILSGWKIEFR